MKIEWKKTEKEFYLPANNPVVVNIPKLKYFSITGTGNPNHEAFQEKITALYGLAYAVRMMPKSGVTPPGYQEYTVYPLEGIWDLTESGRQSKDWDKSLDKDQLVYKIMIRQPDFVTDEVFQLALAKAEKKSSSPLFRQVAFEEMEDGLCVQMTHIGTFDSEPASFARMDEYLDTHGLVRTTKVHKEIYLSDFRKTKSEDLKTVLRYFVKQR
jgi:hypothetical protein